jgi:hypothetical protein
LATCARALGLDLGRQGLHQPAQHLGFEFRIGWPRFPLEGFLRRVG